MGSAIVLVLLAIGFVVSVFVFLYVVRDRELNVDDSNDGDSKNDSDFLTNVTRIRPKVLKFGHGSISHGRDSRYWDKDDRRRDDDYDEDTMENTDADADNISNAKLNNSGKKKSSNNKSSFDQSKGSQARGLYNEAGRDELKMYEAEYESSLKNFGNIKEELSKDWHHNDGHLGNENSDDDIDDEYDDGIDLQDSQAEDYGDASHGKDGSLNVERFHKEDNLDSSRTLNMGTNRQNYAEGNKSSSVFSDEGSSLSSRHLDKTIKSTKNVNVLDGQSGKKSTVNKRPPSKKKQKRRKYSGSCEMKLLNSTAQLVEPLESRKFARFSLQYTKVEDKPDGQEQWVPRFAGHQSLRGREQSFFARDQKINCGFVKGPKGYPGTGFDLAEDDRKYISSCHIAVASCIFGNSDRLRTPMGKTVSRLSRKNVCFVMFLDEISLQTLSREGQMPDSMGFVGLWKIIVVKNLPYDDMRRVGKIPKFLAHRLFPSARYSIWLDSKLRLQLDPLLILEYFLWRKGHEYAISNHYDRHCLWEEVAQNKKLNKYNHTVIEEQFEFYLSDGLKRFNASDPNKLLPSNVPEGSFIVRAHTPMSNLFSCLWFNEVDRFTPRDQLSFAYTYHKLRRTNPDKPFFLNMFKDCERRKIAKLFHHRREESKNVIHDAVE